MSIWSTKSRNSNSFSISGKSCSVVLYTR